MNRREFFSFAAVAPVALPMVVNSLITMETCEWKASSVIINREDRERFRYLSDGD